MNRYKVLKVGSQAVDVDVDSQIVDGDSQVVDVNSQVVDMDCQVVDVDSPVADVDVDGQVVDVDNQVVVVGIENKMKMLGNGKILLVLLLKSNLPVIFPAQKALHMVLLTT